MYEDETRPDYFNVVLCFIMRLVKYLDKNLGEIIYIIYSRTCNKLVFCNLSCTVACTVNASLNEFIVSLLFHLP